MKKKAIIWAVIAVGLVGIIVGASVLYNNLSKEHKANNVVVLLSSKEETANDEIVDETTSEEETTSQSDKETTTSNQSSGKDKNSSTDKNSSADKNNNQSKPNNKVDTNSKVTTGSKVQISSESEISSEEETSSDDTYDKVYFFDFTVVDANGKDVKLADFLGKPIVLNFWTSWCGYCKQEMPDFEKAAKAYPDVNFVMVNATCDKRETEAKAKKYIEENNLDLDFYFDVYKDAVEEYGIRSYPTTYFLDPKGNVVSYSAGSLDYDGLVDCIKMVLPE